MPSGRKPNLQRRRLALKLRSQGRTLGEIAERFGITKQAVWSLIHARTRLTHTRAIACTGCGNSIVSAGALPRDAVDALCVSCIEGREDVPFGRRLKALRLAAGLAQADLARRARLSPGSLRAYEDGLRQPRHASTTRLTRVLGTNLLTPPGAEIPCYGNAV